MSESKKSETNKPNKPRKTGLRRRFRALRNNLPFKTQQAHARAVADHLARSGELLRARTVAGYAAADGEVDLTPVFEILWRMNTQIALPVINPLGTRLDFYRHSRDSPLVCGRFDILVPNLRAEHLPLLRVDLLLVPLVAVDSQGTRLGMGGGFYDRTLMGLPHQLRPRLMGVAHACQVSDESLPHDAWDIRLDAVVTELGVTRFRRSPIR
jgi:5-formyltetrahydrofolate cyclo-ligase